MLLGDLDQPPALFVNFLHVTILLSLVQRRLGNLPLFCSLLQLTLEIVRCNLLICNKIPACFHLGRFSIKDVDRLDAIVDHPK